MKTDPPTGPRPGLSGERQPPFPRNLAMPLVPSNGRSSFISYSHRDREWLDKLTVHLSLLPEQLTIWDDRRIPPGAQWLEEIKASLAAARVAILLVTPHFLHSEFIRDVELPLLLDAADRGDLKIIQIIVRPTVLGHLPRLTGSVQGGWSSTLVRLARIQPFNAYNEPLNAMSETQQDALFVEVAYATWNILGRLSNEPRGDYAAP